MFLSFFLAVSYNMLKNQRTEGEAELTSARTLLYAAEASQSYLVFLGIHEIVKYRVFRCRYRDTHKPYMGGENPDVHNASYRSYGVPELMAYVSSVLWL